MKKNDKKIEKQIIKALNNVCDTLTADTEGFRWLTHFVNFTNVQQSLRIVVVFDSDQALSKARGCGLNKTISVLVEKHLEKCEIFIADSEKAIIFDTEEQGADVNSARWCCRYTSH